MSRTTPIPTTMPVNYSCKGVVTRIGEIKQLSNQNWVGEYRSPSGSVYVTKEQAFAAHARLAVQAMHACLVMAAPASEVHSRQNWRRIAAMARAVKLRAELDADDAAKATPKSA